MPLTAGAVFGQRLDSLNASSLNNVSAASMAKLNKEYSRMDKAIQKKSEQMLNGLQQQEANLQQKLRKVDSTRAGRLFAFSKSIYQKLQAQVQSPVGTTGTPVTSMSAYVPKLDSMNAAMKFLQQGNGLQQITSGKLQQVQALSASLQQLQGRLQVANSIQEFVKDRQQLLAGQLSGYGLGSSMLGMNKQVYYYQQQLEQYKSMLNDRQQLQDAVLRKVATLPVYQSFLQKNSWLSGMFPQPSAADTSTAALSRTAVENEIKAKYGNQVTNPIGYMQNQVPAGQAQTSGMLSKLQNMGSLGGSSAGAMLGGGSIHGASSLPGGSSTAAMPDFVPNGQKVKTFLQRIEYGFNIQSQKTNYLLPTTSELAVMAGYKLSDKATVGIGASYNVGWGNSLNAIHVSSQGMGLRSFVDIKAKGSIWLTGGFEYDYLSAFANLRDVYSNLQLWQKSALAGITKKVKLGKQTSSLQLLYDFLHAVNNPTTPPFVFRVGYSL
jgi:hypothetical protein